MTSDPSELAAQARGGGIAPLAWPVATCRGADAADLLSRLSTNDLAPLKRGLAVTTLFLNPNGRVVARVLLQPAAEWRALSEPGPGDDLATWVDRYTFGDACEIRSEPAMAAALVFGERGLALAPGALGEPGATAEDSSGRLWSRRDLGRVAAAFVTGPADAVRAACEHDGLVRVDDRVLCQLRVEEGEPSMASDLASERFPLEAGLVAEVSFTKGCYTGQEVVARQDTYGKVARRLVRLAFEPGRVPVAGEAIDGPTRECAVTTVAPAPSTLASGQRVHLALGYVSTRQPPGSIVTATGISGRALEPDERVG